MSLEGNLEYAATRVQCQYGERPDANEWRRLEASHDLGQYLEAARGGIFGPWISAIDRSRDVHVIERTLRGAWRNYVRTVAAWHPREWQPWLAWLEWLPTLSLIPALRHPGTSAAWLSADPVLGPAMRESAGERPAELSGTALAAFAPAAGGRISVSELWLARWRKLRPQLGGFTELLATAVCKTLREHVQDLEREDANGSALRDRLRGRLERLFRRAVGTPIAALCHLILVALDVERLRGGLAGRSLFAASR